MRLETFELRRLFIPSAQRSERFSREPAPFNLRKFVSLSFGERRAMCDEGQERMAEGEGGGRMPPGAVPGESNYSVAQAVRPVCVCFVGTRRRRETTICGGGDHLYVLIA